MERGREKVNFLHKFSQVILATSKMAMECMKVKFSDRIMYVPLPIQKYNGWICGSGHDYASLFLVSTHRFRHSYLTKCTVHVQLVYLWIHTILLGATSTNLPLHSRTKSWRQGLMAEFMHKKQWVSLKAVFYGNCTAVEAEGSSSMLVSQEEF